MSGLGFNYPGDDAYYNDAYVTWLVHCDAAEPVMIDHSARQNGPVVLSNTGMAGSGFGLTNSVINFPANALAYSPQNLDNSFNLAANDFTIDWWEYRFENASARPSWVWDTLGAVYAPMLIWYDGVNQVMYFYASNDQASWNLASAVPMGPLTINTWNHFAIVRKGNILYIYKNGVRVSSTAFTGYFNPCTYGPCLGCWPRSDGYYYFYGYMDEFRVSNGIARWTGGTFTVPTAPYGPEVDLNTKLLIHFGGTTDDTSSYRRGPGTVTGTVTISNGTGKFGRASGRFDGASYITFPDSADWVIGTQDFTFDAWVYLDQGYPPVNNFALLSQMTSVGSYSDRHLFAYIGSNGAVVSDAFAGSAQIYMTATAAAIVPLNTWTHVAVVRNGTAVQIYINGVLQSGYLLPANTSFQDLTGPMTVGAMFSDQKFQGYIDEPRLVIGKAMWLANFTPPTEAYPFVPDKTVLLLHFDTDFKDSSQKRKLSAVGSPTNVTLSTAQKKFGSASALYPGSAASVHFLNSPDFGFSVEDFTIDCWLYATDAAFAVQHAVFGQCASDLTNLSCGALLHTTRCMYCSFGKTGSDWYTYNITGVTPVTPNTWYHYAIVKQGNIIKQYLNGVQDGPSLDFGNGPMSSSSLYFVVGELGYSAYYWQGYIDEFRVTKGKALWTANFTPPTQPS